MNPNVLLAVLERKNIITRAEAEKVSDWVNSNPQPTHYADAARAIEEVIGEPVQNPILPQVDTPKVEAKAKKSTDKKDK